MLCNCRVALGFDTFDVIGVDALAPVLIMLERAGRQTVQ
jgi:hypothetical protein